MPQITLSREEAQKLVNFCSKHNSKKFFIAKDTGAYLGYSVGAKPEDQCLFYFSGCHPEKNPDTYWETGQRLFGGDDFGFHVELTPINQLLSYPNVKKITVSVTKTKVKFTAV